jgi:phosphate transport system protein
MGNLFADNLDKLQNRLIKMGSAVEEQTSLAFRAIQNCDRDTALKVLALDKRVDQLNLKIDKQCQRILALHQPVARDLRLVISALKLTMTLERMGNLAKNVARYVLDPAPPCRLINTAGLDRIAGDTLIMVRKALDAFVNSDDLAARHVARSDERIDVMRRTIITELKQEMYANPDCIDDAIACLSILRHIERISDHASAVADIVVFLVTGIPTHNGHADDSDNAAE